MKKHKPNNCKKINLETVITNSLLNTKVSQVIRMPCLISCIWISQNNEYIQSVARCLQMMLRVDEYRFAFVNVDGISTLIRILSTRVNFQVSLKLKCVNCLVQFKFDFLFIGTIPIGLLPVGAHLQSPAGRQDEQVQCHTHIGRYTKRLCQREGDTYHFGCLP